MSDEIKRGFWRDNEEAETLREMIDSVRSGACDWTRRKDWVVIAGYDEGELSEIMVTKLQRIEPV